MNYIIHGDKDEWAAGNNFTFYEFHVKLVNSLDFYYIMHLNILLYSAMEVGLLRG